jgi:predicted glycosyltransferase involved in capsule biosynthesis
MSFSGKLKAVVKLSGTRGLYLPLAYDHAKPASARLFFAHVSFYIASTSVIALHFSSSLLSASITAILFFLLCTVLYMLKDLTKAKFDLDDRSVDLESSSSDKPISAPDVHNE